jgi:hypothetical protein
MTLSKLHRFSLERSTVTELIHLWSHPSIFLRGAREARQLPHDAGLRIESSRFEYEAK